ncbi:MAG: rhodanese-like domain-containing protein [Polyangiales bacterium]
MARGASVLDARDAGAFSSGHLPGAQLYAWSLFTGTGAQRGRLRADLSSIAAGLAALGVDESRPTLVYGAAGTGNGEEGHAARGCSRCWDTTTSRCSTAGSKRGALLGALWSPA